MPSPQRKATQVAKTTAPKRFVFLLLDNFTMLSFAGAIEPLRIANRVAGEQLYTWVLAGEGDMVSCSNGAAFKLDIGLEEMRAFLVEHPVAYPIVIVDPMDPPRDFATPRGLPITYLIAPDGKLARQFLGPVTAHELENAIEASGGKVR